MPSVRPNPLLAHERRVCRLFDARGSAGLGEALAHLDGIVFGGHYRLDSLYAAGGEGVVYLATDLQAPGDRLVAKLPLVPFHRPVELSSNFLRRRREQLREEARNLRAIGSRFLPKFRALEEIPNPLLDRSRGGEFSVGEPVLLMERLPGFDLDVWLARVHRSDVPQNLLRRNLDRVAVVLLKALAELESRGFHYMDLRPGNLRMMGRPERRIRLLDAGSLVEHGDESGRFPHVPAYLPPEVFHRRRETGELPVPNAAIEAVMAGRTLWEVATGASPEPGCDVDLDRLAGGHVSDPVAEVVEALAFGRFGHVREALEYLERHAKKRVAIPMKVHKPMARPEVRAALGDAAEADLVADVVADVVAEVVAEAEAAAALPDVPPAAAAAAPAGAAALAPGAPLPYPKHGPSNRWTPRSTQAPGHASSAPPPKPAPPATPSSPDAGSGAAVPEPAAQAARGEVGDAILPPSPASSPAAHWTKALSAGGNVLVTTAVLVKRVVVFVATLLFAFAVWVRGLPWGRWYERVRTFLFWQRLKLRSGWQMLRASRLWKRVFGG